MDIAQNYHISKKLSTTLDMRFAFYAASVWPSVFVAAYQLSHSFVFIIVILQYCFCVFYLCATYCCFLDLSYVLLFIPTRGTMSQIEVYQPMLTCSVLLCMLMDRWEVLNLTHHPWNRYTILQQLNSYTKEIIEVLKIRGLKMVIIIYLLINMDIKLNTPMHVILT